MNDSIDENLDATPEEILDEKDYDDAVDYLAKKMDSLGIDEGNELAKAQKDIGMWTEYYTENIQLGKADQEFLVRNQWSLQDMSDAQRLNKTLLSVNKLYDSVKKTAGEMRKNCPDLIVRSLNGKATQQEIDLRTSYLRTLSYSSQVNLIYQQMLMSSLSLGFGAFKVGLDYESQKSFNKVVKFFMIKDPTLSYFDPIAEMPHKGDGNFCACAYILSKEEFYALYPTAGDVESFQLLTNVSTYLYNPSKSIVVVDYTRKVWFPTVIYELSNGEVVTKEEWQSMQPLIKKQRELAESVSATRGMMNSIIPKIVGQRMSQNYRTYSMRMTKNKIVEVTRFPSKYLPIVFCAGDSHYLDGREYTRSYIRDAVDAQRALNYEFSEMVADVRNRRREQWIGTPDNVRGHEQMWYNPELQQGILLAEPDRKTQQMPNKLPPWEPSQGLLGQYQVTSRDLKELTGFEEELAGNQTNAISGVAIARRQYAGSMSAYIFEDNWRQAIAQGGRIALDLLPAAIGDKERTLPLRQASGETKNIIFNKKLSGGKIDNPIRPGEFDVEIDVGPSFAVQKEATTELLMQLATGQLNAQTSPLLLDIIAKNMDIQYQPQLVKRFETLVPPQILSAEKGEPPPPPQPNPQDAVIQSNMAEQQSKTELNKARTQSELAKAQSTAATVQNHSAEVQLRQQDQAIKVAKLQQDGMDAQTRAHAQVQSHALDALKTHQDYEKDMTKTMVDLHKHYNPVGTSNPEE